MGYVQIQVGCVMCAKSSVEIQGRVDFCMMWFPVLASGFMKTSLVSCFLRQYLYCVI